MSGAAEHRRALLQHVVHHRMGQPLPVLQVADAVQAAPASARVDHHHQAPVRPQQFQGLGEDAPEHGIGAAFLQQAVGGAVQQLQSAHEQPGVLGRGQLGEELPHPLDEIHPVQPGEAFGVVQGPVAQVQLLPVRQVALAPLGQGHPVHQDPVARVQVTDAPVPVALPHQGMDPGDAQVPGAGHRAQHGIAPDLALAGQGVPAQHISLVPRQKRQPENSETLDSG